MFPHLNLLLQRDGSEGGSFVESARRYAVQRFNLRCTVLDEEVRKLLTSVYLNKMKGCNFEPDSLLAILSELL